MDVNAIPEFGRKSSFYHISRQLFSDALIYGLGSAISGAISFLMLPLYTRSMPPEEYGKIDVLLTVNSILVVIGTLGITSGIVLIFQDDDERFQKRMITSTLLFQILWVAILTTFLVVFAHPLSLLIFKTSSYSALLVLAVIMLPGQIMIGYFQNLHRFKRRPLPFVFITAGVTGLSAILNIWFVVIRGDGAMGAITGQLIAYCAFAAIGLLMSIRYLGIVISVDDIRHCLALGMPFILASSFQYLLPVINRIFLVDYVGLNGTGIFAAGLKLCYVVVFVNSAFEMAYYPFSLSIQKHSNAQEIYIRISRIYAGVLMLGSALMFLFAKHIVGIVLGQIQYAEAYSIMGPLILAFWVRSMQTTFQMGLVIAKKTWHVIWVYPVSVLASIILNAAFIRLWGIQGAAWALLGIELVLTVTLFYANQRVYKIAHPVKTILHLLIGYLTLLVFVAILPTLSAGLDIIVRGLAAAVFSLFVIFFSGVVDRAELASGWQFARQKVSHIKSW